MYINKLKHVVFLALGLSILFSCEPSKKGERLKPIVKEPVDYVNPYMGNISHLLIPTYPTVHLPNSMLRVIPKRMDYTGDRLEGLPVVTTSHRGKSAFTICPKAGNTEELKAQYAYSYDNETIKPYAYDVYLDEENIHTSFSVSHQSGIYSFKFPSAEGKNLLISSEKGKIQIGEIR